MKSLKEIMQYPGMWRTSKGFGVHSPFAYNFITRVICEHEAAYYAYSEIAAFCPKSKKATFNEIFAGRDMSISEGQLIFRILCYFNPGEVVEIGHGHEVTGVILRNAVPNARTSNFHHSRTGTPLPDSGCVIIANQCSPDERDSVAKYLKEIVSSRDAIIIMRNLRSVPSFAGIWKEITESADHGMTFTDGWTGIFVARRNLPRMSYRLLM